MEQIKKYIRGNKERGHEVIAELEELGGKNILILKGTQNDALYYISTSKHTVPNAIQAVSEDSFTGQLLLTHSDWEEIELPKDKYSKTYEKCCKELNIEIHDLIVLDNILDTKEIVYRKNLDRLLNSFRKLLICRDAYWKIARDWKYDVNKTEEYFYIVNKCGRIVKEHYMNFNHILAFSTEEMLDTFYENFKNEIENCKELL